MKTGPGPLFFPLSVSLSLFSLNLVTHLFIPLSCPLSPSLCIRGTTRLQENTATHRFFFLFCRVQESGAGCFNTCGLCQGKENQSVKGASELSLLFGFFFFSFPKDCECGTPFKEDGAERRPLLPHVCTHTRSVRHQSKSSPIVTSASAAAKNKNSVEAVAATKGRRVYSHES